MVAWDDIKHLTQLEKRCSAHWFSADPTKFPDAPPTGLIIGEAPGRNTRTELPMYPYPATSSGGRLFEMSGLTIEEYLGRIVRRNLVAQYHETWPTHHAFERANELRTLMPVGIRVLLLGKKVGRAFGVRTYFEMTRQAGVWFVTIPHPSGLNRDYNDENIRNAARAALWWCAGLKVEVKL